MEPAKEETEVLEKLESLAMAGYHFREGYSSKILVATLDELPLPERCVYPNGPYILGPEEGKLLLFRRDIFNRLNTMDISQTEVPGVIQIITQHRPMPENVNQVAYLIHLSHDTLPKDVHYDTIDLMVYNQFREKFKL
jgi:hypothetical protein